jgi:molybdopterin synthase sulfur carrier subunit
MPATSIATVNLVYLARLREAFGRPGEPFELSSGATTVGALLDALRARGGAFATELAPGRAVRIAVNHAMASDDTAIAVGDEVAVFPPVTGG